MNDYKASRKFLSVDNLPNQVTIEFSNEVEHNNELSVQPSTNPISDNKTEINFNDDKKDFYYHIIRKVLYPFALTGAPIGFYLKHPDKVIKTFGLLNVNLTCVIFFNFSC